MMVEPHRSAGRAAGEGIASREESFVADSPKLTKLHSQSLGLDMGVSLEHRQALVPRHAGNLHDAQPLFEQP